MSDKCNAQALAATSGNETILLVEDEEVVRLMLTEVLTHHGYAVLNAGRGANALALAAKAARPIDLLVTDISMPGMTGWDLAGSLRINRPGLPVLFISGHNQHASKGWGGMDPPPEFLFKPFSLEAFLVKARQMLDRGKTSAPARPADKSSAGSPSTLL
jgi:DNA-binding response OmpR family regulator